MDMRMLPHLILLPLEFLEVLKLLSFQGVQPVPQLFGFLPVHTQIHQNTFRIWILTMFHQDKPHCLYRLRVVRYLCWPQLVLIEMINIQRLASVCQNLLLLLPFSLLLTSPLRVSLFLSAHKHNTFHSHILYSEWWWTESESGLVESSAPSAGSCCTGSPCWTGQTSSWHLHLPSS